MAKLPKLRTVVRRAPTFRMVPVSGAQASLTRQGLISLNVWHESISPEGEMLVDQESDKPEEQRDEVEMSRIVEMGMLMPAAVARAIAEVLMKQVEEFEIQDREKRR